MTLNLGPVYPLPQMTLITIAPDRLRRLVEGAAAVAGQTDLHSVLETTVEIAMELTGARYGALGVVGETGYLTDFLHAGMDPATAGRISHPPRGQGVLGTITRDGRTVRIDQIQDHPDSAGFPDGHPKMDSFLGVPVRAGTRVFGNLYLTEKDGGFSSEDESLVEALAMIAGSAVRTARLQAKLRTLAVVEDRERIARDLHDNVIQNLFGAGLSLQALSQKLENAELRATLDTNVRVLNDSITSLREFIFDLNRPRGLPEEIGELVAELVGQHETAIDVSYTGHLRGLPESLIDDAVLLVRESVSNAIRHSGSDRVSVDIHGDHGKLTITVVDEGIGFDTANAEEGLGLANLRSRARRSGGDVVVTSVPGQGTSVRAELPI